MAQQIRQFLLFSAELAHQCIEALVIDHSFELNAIVADRADAVDLNVVDSPVVAS
jgi:hypothetical protein